MSVELRDLRLDEETWKSASPLRRAEWRAAIEDILDASAFGPAMVERYLLVTRREADFLFEALDDDGCVTASCVLRRELLAELVREYERIIVRLDEGAAFRDATWLHAIDMAKKVVHDKAAERLAAELPALSDHHPTLRKIFTLVFSLVVDTTEMVHARHHGTYKG